MARNLSVLKIIVAGAVSAGMITACGDRFGTYKSRRFTMDQCRDYVRKHGKPETDCNNGKTFSNPGPTNTPAKDEDSKLAPVTPNASYSQGNTPAPINGSGKKKLDSPASNVLTGPGPQTTGDYPKAFWLERFNKLISSSSPSLAQTIKGITIQSGKLDGQNSTSISIKAVIKFRNVLNLLTMVPAPVEVKFDSEKVTPIAFELRPSADAPADKDVSDSVILSATCLKPEDNKNPCEEIGVMIEMKTSQKFDGKEGVAIAVFMVKPDGGNNDGNAFLTGISMSNMGTELQPFGEGERLMLLAKKPEPKKSETKPAAGPGVSGGASNQPTQTTTTVTGQNVPDWDLAEPTDENVMGGMKNVLELVKEKHKIATEARVAAEKAKDQKDKAVAEAQAKLAETAAADLTEGNSVVTSMNDSLQDEKLKNEAGQLLAESVKLKLEADEAAKAARKAAFEAADPVNVDQNPGALPGDDKKDNSDLDQIPTPEL